MKTNKLIMFLATASLLLCGCNNDEFNSSSNNGNSSATSSGGEITIATEWSSSVKALLTKYVGEVLPYPALFSDASKLTYSEYEDEYDDTYLGIYYESSTFLLKDYRFDLEANDWLTIKSYNGNPYQAAENYYGELTDVYQSTKASSDKSVAYYLQYFVDFDYDDDGNIVYFNTIYCSNNLVAQKSKNTTWTDDELKYLESALTISDIPFFQWGYDTYMFSSNNSYALSENEIVIQSEYYEDLSSAYADVLVANGFEIDDPSSKEADYYILTKDIYNGLKKVATIEASMYFFGFNQISFTYLPEKASTPTWPSTLFDEIYTRTGYRVPEFTATSYTYYTKHSSIYISGATTTSVEDSYKTALSALDINVYYFFSYYAQTFEENLYFTFYDDGEYDDDYNLTSVTSFELIVDETAPTSTFSTNWPETAINSYLSTNQISVTSVPSLTATLGSKGLKYYLDEYNDDALTIEIFDKDQSIFNSYKQAMIDSLWWKLDSSDASFAIENASGALKIELSQSDNITYIVFSVGSGTAHSETFEFSSSTLNIKQGGTKATSIILQMLPEGTITYACTDTTGKISVDSLGNVTVASDATLNSEATITATWTFGTLTKTATCVVKVVNEVIDTITSSTVSSSTSNGYQDYTYTSADSGVKYSFNAILNSSYIQINKKNNKVGIVASSTDKICTSITFDFNNKTSNGKGIYIYVDNETIELSDLYTPTDSQIELQGSVTYSGTSSMTFNITGSYSHVGIVSMSNAIYLNSISFTWC